MPLAIDPLYHTETMVNILRQQGSNGHAMELAERILQTQPDHTGLLQIHAELKAEQRANFERFQRAGKKANRQEKNHEPQTN